MSLDITLTAVRHTSIWDGNITHNLTIMADEVDLYTPIWRPSELGIERAEQLIPFLETGYSNLVRDKDRLEKYNPANGWGSYETLLEFTREYLEMCKNNPDAIIEACP